MSLRETPQYSALDAAHNAKVGRKGWCTTFCDRCHELKPCRRMKISDRIGWLCEADDCGGAAT